MVLNQHNTFWLEILCMQWAKRSPLTASECRPTGINREPSQLTLPIWWQSFGWCGQSLLWSPDSMCMSPSWSTYPVIFSWWMKWGVWCCGRGSEGSLYDGVCVYACLCFTCACIWVWVPVCCCLWPPPRHLLAAAQCPFQLPVGHFRESSHGSELIRGRMDTVCW